MRQRGSSFERKITFQSMSGNRNKRSNRNRQSATCISWSMVRYLEVCMPVGSLNGKQTSNAYLMTPCTVVRSTGHRDLGLVLFVHKTTTGRTKEAGKRIAYRLLGTGDGWYLCFVRPRQHSLVGLGRAHRKEPVRKV